MSSDKLQKQLDNLLVELEKHDIGEERKAQLAVLIADIEMRLKSDFPVADEESLVDEVDSFVTYFEAEHPSLSLSLKNIMMTLSNMGI